VSTTLNGEQLLTADTDILREISITDGKRLVQVPWASNVGCFPDTGVVVKNRCTA